MENLFPALHFQSVCVPCFEVGLFVDNICRGLVLYPFSQSMSFGWGIEPITLKLIIDKYDPVAFYFIVLGSNLYTVFVFPV